ncbi:hypothetical protein PBT90_19210 [Algoriphagus halophytocola]|uniref:Uncharacterized protein n=1 Tax=Algoriphagus halophytocola TaxID=2991499 RepID=A0ABY6MD67_9BACT|nr:MULTISPECIES: hypothetical protein [unclassified Algoriphagus]UZD21645.1 hypothetical protein OM944_13345 [Algoriphagus sp. TR-M5]WBL42857.1 hypothetical protein PBT90_19210 [Algoriphagus sp. TR-M9]
MNEKSIPFIYRSFFNFWLLVVLPATLIALTLSKLYYNNTINLEPLKDPNVWFYLLLLQVFVSFFSYIWVYRPQAKKLKDKAH